MRDLMCGLGLLALMVGSCAAAPVATDDAGTADSRLDPPACAPLEGVYQVSFAKQSGDCAELPDQLARFDEAANTSALSSRCESAIDVNAEDCSRQEDGSCPILDEAGATIGEAHLVALFSQSNAMRLEGTVTIALTADAGGACSATYAVSGTKLRP